MGDKEQKNREDIKNVERVSDELSDLKNMISSLRKRNEDIASGTRRPESRPPQMSPEEANRYRERRHAERHVEETGNPESDRERMRKALEKKLREEEKRAYSQARKAAAEKQKAEKRALELERRRAEAREKQEKQRRKDEYQKVIEEQRALQRQRREEAGREYRQLKHEIEEKKKEEKRERSEKSRRERQERAELRRQRRIARKSAELGGGIVKIHGTEVTTELQPVPSFSWHDLFGYISRKDKKAASSPEEMEQLKKEAEDRKAAARETAARLRLLKKEKRKNNPIILKLRAFESFCERRKKELLIAFSVGLTFIIVTGTFINNYTAYEYSYNGKTLGYVKNKDDVLQITDMVREALTEERDQEVNIDARDDISFDRVFVFDDRVTIDSQENVLKRLTYMGDLNVKACGIYIDDRKVGAVNDKEAAAEVLSNIKDRYVSGKSGSEVLEAVITDDIEIRESNTDVEDISTVDEMVNILCTSGTKEVTHTVVPGETLSDIATDYGLSENDIMATNEGIDPKKLEVGKPLLIKQEAPLLSVKVTEKRTYDKTVKFEVEEKKTDELYKGTTRVDRKGEDGKTTITEKTVYVNGEVSDSEVLAEKVKKEPVAKIVSVGTADTPPTTGTGTYIWPTNGKYRISSRFGPRWGRNHDGIDMACSTGTDVLASDGGTVIEAGYHGSYGNLVVIDHQNGIHTYYAHNSKLLVSVGDKVYQGYHIAESGSTGRSTGPHIHFGVKVNGVFKNPENYLP
ncbi:MAG: peptidoglycan DD-metalloendopeptidase family protein [Clostridiales bacterium]|nr:peptidoglycan DD-metalloendopeptidase family protein [Clostridiales bacterium]